MEALKKTVIFLTALFFTTQGSAAVLTLNSGKKIEGEIIEQSDEKVIINFKGVTLTFYQDEIKGVDGEDVPQDAGNKKENVQTFIEEQSELKEKVKKFFDVNDFKGLENIVTQLRASNETFKNGVSKLEYFYIFLKNAYGRVEIKYKEDYFDKLDLWQKDLPDSITPKIAKADAYIQFAGEARGGGWSYTVEEDDEEIFETYLTDAWEILSKIDESEFNDPEVYVLKLTSAILLGTLQREDILKLFEEGQKHFPTYYHLYSTMANFLLPRWMGGEGELEYFADRYATELKDKEGDSLYARIVWSIFWSGALGTDSNDFFKYFHFSWDRVKQGMFDIEKQYPDSMYNVNLFALLSCTADDRETAKIWFQKLNKNWDDDKKSIWKREKAFQNWKDWAYGGSKNADNQELRFAAKSGDLNKVKELVESGMDVNLSDANGVTPLMEAIASVNNVSSGFDIEMVKFLLDNGADVNARDAVGLTPLFFATRIHKQFKEVRQEIMNLLLERGADLNVKTDGDWTILHDVVNGGDNELFDQLMEKGVFYNGANKAGRTALYLAVDSNNQYIAKRLLSKNDLDVNTSVGEWTPLYLAIYNDLDDVALLILNKPDVNVNYKVGEWSPLSLAIYKEKISIAQKILERQEVEVNERDNKGWTYLHKAVYNNNLALVEALVKHPSIDINAKYDSDQRTALQVAVEHGYTDIIRVLLTHKDIDVNVRDKRQDTPLHLGIKYGQYDAVKLLLENGADINMRDGFNHNALEIAKGAGKTGIYDFIKNYK